MVMASLHGNKSLTVPSATIMRFTSDLIVQCSNDYICGSSSFRF